jgi:hypothetical protein
MIKQILTDLLERLWVNYCQRVEYARRYRDLVMEKGGRVVNDHIAFRTFNTKTGELPAGIEALARLITPLGYEAKGSYEFQDKHLTARHYEHEDPLMPKIFISQLEVDRLPEDAQRIISASVADARNLLDTDTQAILRYPQTMLENNGTGIVDRLYQYITQRPWSPPRRDDVIAVNKVSQYAAWTLLHGNNVNHFTAYINEQQVAEWPDIEKTVEGLKAAGIPMKAEIEGAPGSKLRQTATQAIDEECDVREADGSPGKLKWSYAYYELAERNDIPGPDGKPTRFQGFLGAQATHLFEMTKR